MAMASSDHVKCVFLLLLLGVEVVTAQSHSSQRYAVIVPSRTSVSMSPIIDRNNSDHSNERSIGRIVLRTGASTGVSATIRVDVDELSQDKLSITSIGETSHRPRVWEVQENILDRRIDINAFGPGWIVLEPRLHGQCLSTDSKNDNEILIVMTIAEH